MANDKPRVSIGLPVFNGEKYLEQAIDSILKQTYPDFELIISDNASTDQTQTICQSYAALDQRVRYSRNNQNIGAAPNFNRVFRLSSSVFFKWAAYDDLIAPEFLSNCIEVLDQNPDVILCYSRAFFIDKYGTFQEKYSPRPNVCALDRPNERFREFILHRHKAMHQFGVFRSNSLNKTKLLQSFPSSDEVLLAELALLGRFIEIPEHLFFNRIHEEQSTRGAMTPQRSRITWFDSSLIGKIVLAHWMYFFACLGVIKNAPVTKYEKMKCYLHMGRWCLIPANFRAMGKDVLLAAKKSLEMTWRAGQGLVISKDKNK